MKLDLGVIRQRIIEAQPALASGAVPDWEEASRQWTYERTNLASTSLVLDHDGRDLADLRRTLRECDDGGIYRLLAEQMRGHAGQQNATRPACHRPAVLVRNVRLDY